MASTAQNQDALLAGYRRNLVTPDATPRELLFEFADATQRHYRCELLDDGDRGLEAQITAEDCGYFGARRCASREQAEQWARQRQRWLEAGGPR